MIPYILQMVAFVTLVIKTLVDWPDHHESRRKRRGDIVLVLLGLGTVVGGLVTTHRDRLASATHEAAASAQVAQMRSDFHEQLGNVSGQLQDIRGQVVSEPLLRKISSLQEQVADLKHPPSRNKAKAASKVTLVATLWDADAYKLPIKSATASVGPDRVVAVKFSVMNPTESPLREPIDGWIRNCEGCEFVGPIPDGMIREDETSPTLQFQLSKLLPHTVAGKYIVRIHVPAGCSSIAIDIHTYCDGCTSEKEPQRLTIVLVPE